VKQLDAYFRGVPDPFDLPITFIEATEFEKMVWLALRSIPGGEVRSYQWLAARVGNPRAARAVGQALGRNPLPIVLPCHRVLRADGGLGGFSSGVEVKRRLLELEGFTEVNPPSSSHGSSRRRMA
jgi:methylated-DNA-[protein]-cysteine S-methyltransferase